MSAPPAPWTARKPTIHTSAKDPFGVNPHITEAPTKTITPMTHSLVCP